MGDMDEAIDVRVGEFGYGFCHAQGMGAMEKGIDRGLWGGLRIVDPSIIRLPLRAHYQAVCVGGECYGFHLRDILLSLYVYDDLCIIFVLKLYNV